MTYLLKCHGGDGLYFARGGFSYFSARADAHTHTHAHNNIQLWAIYFIVCSDGQYYNRIATTAEDWKTAQILYSSCIIIMSWRWRTVSVEGNVIIWADVNPSKRGPCSRVPIFCTGRVRGKYRFRLSHRSDEKVLHYIVLLLLSFYIIFRRIFLSQSINCTYSHRTNARYYVYTHTTVRILQHIS